MSIHSNSSSSELTTATPAEQQPKASCQKNCCRCHCQKVGIKSVRKMATLAKSRRRRFLEQCKKYELETPAKRGEIHLESKSTSTTTSTTELCFFFLHSIAAAAAVVPLIPSNPTPRQPVGAPRRRRRVTYWSWLTVQTERERYITFTTNRVTYFRSHTYILQRGILCSHRITRITH